MHWKLKAWSQRILSSLPNSIGNGATYQLQKRVGRLREIRAEDYVRPVARYFAAIRDSGQSAIGKTFLEIGAGRRLTTPLTLWLCGAAAVISVDLYRLLDNDFFLNDLRYLSNNEQVIRDMMGDLADEELFSQRIQCLREWMEDPNIRVDDILSEAHIEYRAPADAGRLDLPDQSVDYHVSITVMEHIPPSDIVRILNEARRIIRPDGLLVHYIDYSDHFAFFDSNIARVHFVQFSDAEWERWAGNRFAYHNRLRSDDFDALFRDSGFEFIQNVKRIDEHSIALMQSGRLEVHERFAAKSAEEIACTDAFIVASKTPG